MQIQAELGEGHANIIDAYEVGMVHLGSVASLQLNNCRNSDSSGGSSGRGGGGAATTAMTFTVAALAATAVAAEMSWIWTAAEAVAATAVTAASMAVPAAALVVERPGRQQACGPQWGSSSICPTRGAGRRRQPAAIDTTLIPTC